METRLVIAYLLIFAIVVAGALFWRSIARKRHEHYLNMIGRGRYKRRGHAKGN